MGLDVKDSVFIDLSPLRRINTSTLVSAIMEESKKFSSLQSLDDQTDLKSTDWYDSVETMFSNDAIWRIPAFGLVVSFLDRRECKLFAEMISSNRFQDL